MRFGRILLMSLLVIVSLPFVLWFSRDLWLLPTAQRLLSYVQVEQNLAEQGIPHIHLHELKLSSPKHIRKFTVSITGVGDISLGSVRYQPKTQAVLIQSLDLKGDFLALAASQAQDDSDSSESVAPFLQLKRLQRSLEQLDKPLLDLRGQLNHWSQQLGITLLTVEQIQITDNSQPQLPLIFNATFKQVGTEIDKQSSVEQKSGYKQGWVLESELNQPVQAWLNVTLEEKLTVDLQVTPDELPEPYLALLSDWLEASPLQNYPIKQVLAQQDFWQQTALSWKAELDWARQDAETDKEAPLLAGELGLALPKIWLPLKENCQIVMLPIKAFDGSDIQVKSETFHLAYQLSHSKPDQSNLKLTPELPKIKYRGDCLNTWLKAEEKVFANRQGSVELMATHWLLDFDKASVSTDSLTVKTHFLLMGCKHRVSKGADAKESDEKESQGLGGVQSCQRQPIKPRQLIANLKQLSWQHKSSAAQAGINMTLKGDYHHPKSALESGLPEQNLLLDLVLSGQVKLTPQAILFNGWGEKALGLKLAQLILPGNREVSGSELYLKPKATFNLSTGSWQFKGPWSWQGTVQDPLLKQAEALALNGQLAADTKKQSVTVNSQLDWLPVTLVLNHRLSGSASAGVQVQGLQSSSLDFSLNSREPFSPLGVANKLVLPKELELKEGEVSFGFKGSGEGDWKVQGKKNRKAKEQKGPFDNLVIQGKVYIQQLAAAYQGFQLRDLSVPLLIAADLGPEGIRAKLQPTRVNIPYAFTGVELTDIQFGLSGGFGFEGPYGEVSQLTGNLFDGSLALDQLNYPLRGQTSQLVLNSLDLQQLVDLDESQQISITGRVSGQMPLIFFDNSVEVQKGRVYADVPGEINLSQNQAWQAMLLQNEALSASLRHLNYLHYSLMEGELDMTRQGQLSMKIKVQGENRAERQPVNLNFTSEQNIFTLLKALRLSEQISRTLDQSIQRKY